METGIKSLEWDISSHEARNEAERRTLKKQMKKVTKEKRIKREIRQKDRCCKQRVGGYKTNVVEENISAAANGFA